MFVSHHGVSEVLTISSEALDAGLGAGGVEGVAWRNAGFRWVVPAGCRGVGGGVGAWPVTTTTTATAARFVGIEIGMVGILGIRISGGLGLITGFFAGS